jgi:hypothetical protein
MHIRINTSNEKMQQALELLKPLGVEVITGEGSVLDDALFYIARINSKLDNLGQLRHLHKILGEALEFTRQMKPLTEYTTDMLKERRYHQHAREDYYKQLKEKYGAPLDVDGTPLEFDHGFITYGTYDLIHALFRVNIDKEKTRVYTESAGRAIFIADTRD